MSQITAPIDPALKLANPHRLKSGGNVRHRALSPTVLSHSTIEAAKTPKRIDLACG